MIMKKQHRSITIIIGVVCSVCLLVIGLWLTIWALISRSEDANFTNHCESSSTTQSSNGPIERRFSEASKNLDKISVFGVSMNPKQAGVGFGLSFPKGYGISKTKEYREFITSNGGDLFEENDFKMGFIFGPICDEYLNGMLDKIYIYNNYATIFVSNKDILGDSRFIEYVKTHEVKISDMKIGKHNGKKISISSQKSGLIGGSVSFTEAIYQIELNNKYYYFNPHSITHNVDNLSTFYEIMKSLY